MGINPELLIGGGAKLVAGAQLGAGVAFCTGTKARLLVAGNVTLVSGALLSAGTSPNHASAEDWPYKAAMSRRVAE